MMKPTEGRRRVVIEAVQPQIDGGAYPVKRIMGDRVMVNAAVFSDGHDLITCRLLFRHQGDKKWQEVEMEPLGNDLWQADFVVSDIGRYEYTVEGWVDHFLTWREDMKKRLASGAAEPVQFQIGEALVTAAAKRASGADRKQLQAFARTLTDTADPEASRMAAAEDDLFLLMNRYPDRKLAARYGHELEIEVDRPIAAFSAWYEMFPRSTSPEPGRHGTFRDAEALLPYVADMGFDVLYFPPISPIGLAFRKGKNNSPTAAEGDAGSPWAIGSDDGGHTAIHSALGTLEDFEHLLQAAKDFGLEVALDIAFQCAPDHPWVKEHPEFFVHRPDGTIQYAENPPKKYQDIYPLDFESVEWRVLWDSLRDVFLYWAEKGVRIFRVDNPHTKALPFWAWVIPEVKEKFPDAIFLAEAFTRPHIMYHLAKVGFSQSYTYFTWRTTKQQFEEYLEELTQTEVQEFYRPNFWPNTPDILHETLQLGGRAAFLRQLVLAATMTANYGIYGPAFELEEHLPVRIGSEEYLDSEKYEIKSWYRDSPSSLKPEITRVNAIRRSNLALHRNERLRFHAIDNSQMICYSKTTADFSNRILVVVNLDLINTQSAWTGLNLRELDLAESGFDVEDLLTGAHYGWRGGRNFVQLGPGQAHILRISN